MQIDVNPDAKPISFSTVQAADYELIIKEDAAVSEFESAKSPTGKGKSFDFRLSLTDGNGVVIDADTGKPVDGMAGTIYYSCPFEPKDWQGKLRGLFEHLGQSWVPGADTSSLVGIPFRALVGVEVIKKGGRAGEKRNVIKKLVK